MPIRDLIIPEASSAILEPISQQITALVLQRIGLKDAFLDNIYISNDYTKASLTGDDDHHALISKDRCDVKMSVAWNPSETKWDVMSFNYTQAYGVERDLDHQLVGVFRDTIAGVQLTEQQVPCSMTLEFSLQFKNREAAFTAISAITNTSLKDSVLNFQNLSYNYPISNDMLISLYQIYKMRKSGLPLSFWDYLQKGSHGGVQYLRQRTGDKAELVIKRQDIQALGVLEYSQPSPTVENQDSGVNRFVVDFTYVLQFARPDVLRLSFPVVVCNQMIPAWMVRSQEQNILETFSGIFQENSINGYLRMQQSRIPIVIRRPGYDDFRPPSDPVCSAGFYEFFDAVILLDDAATTTINLLDLGDNMQLHPSTAEIMKLHGMDIFGTNGLFNIAVYCNDIPVDQSCLTIDANLVLTIALQDKTKRYHLVLSEANTLQNLDGKWYATLIQYRTFFPITVIRNLQNLIDRGYCYIDGSNKLLQLINNQIHRLLIDQQIKTLITAGHLNHYAYCYATTAEQFAQYLMHTISPVSHRLVYDEYVQICLQAGLIHSSQLSSGYIKTAQGYPFLPATLRAATSYFNLPFRVEQSVVEITRAQPLTKPQ